MGSDNLQPMDMDELHEAAAAASVAAVDGDKGKGEEAEGAEDRGDFVEGDEKSTAENQAADGKDKGQEQEGGDPDIDEEDLKDILADGGIPRDRFNQVISQRNAAQDVADAVLDGRLTPDFVNEMGGGKALSRAIAAGEFTVDDLVAYAAGDDAAGGQEDDGGDDAEEILQKFEENAEKRVDLMTQLADAVADEDEDRQKEIREKIVDLEKEERKLMVQAMGSGKGKATGPDPEEISQIVVEQVAAMQFEQQKEAANPIAEKILEAHPVLDENDMIRETFSAMTQAFLDKGYDLKGAFMAAEKTMFPESTLFSDGDGGGKSGGAVADRIKAAREAAAKAMQGQPPSTSVAGMGEQAAVDVARMTEKEFREMSEREKKRLRGDYVE